MQEGNLYRIDPQSSMSMPTQASMAVYFGIFSLGRLGKLFS
jgi:hypothetical protein